MSEAALTIFTGNSLSGGNEPSSLLISGTTGNFLYGDPTRILPGQSDRSFPILPALDVIVATAESEIEGVLAVCQNNPAGAPIILTTWALHEKFRGRAKDADMSHLSVTALDNGPLIQTGFMLIQPVRLSDGVLAFQIDVDDVNCLIAPNLSREGVASLTEQMPGLMGNGDIPKWDLFALDVGGIDYRNHKHVRALGTLAQTATATCSVLLGSSDDRSLFHDTCEGIICLHHDFGQHHSPHNYTTITVPGGISQSLSMNGAAALKNLLPVEGGTATPAP